MNELLYTKSLLLEKVSDCIHLQVRKHDKSLEGEKPMTHGYLKRCHIYPTYSMMT
jgi:hypothetical protein